MKYIVLFFDDGYLDFEINALPVLDKYSFKSSIAVVSGFLDNSIKAPFSTMSKDSIQFLNKNGHEIAIHSDSHRLHIDLADFSICHNKFKQWFRDKQYGVIIPYSQNLGGKYEEYFKKEKALYIADSKSHVTKWSIRSFLLRIFNHLFKSDINNFIVSNHYYFYTLQNMNTELPLFKRLPIHRNIPISWYKRLIKTMKNNTCLTFAFHSVIDDKTQCDWPEGSISTEDFKELMFFLYKYKKCKIITQKDLIEYAKSKKNIR